MWHSFFCLRECIHCSISIIQGKKIQDYGTVTWACGYLVQWFRCNLHCANTDVKNLITWAVTFQNEYFSYSIVVVLPFHTYSGFDTITHHAADIITLWCYLAISYLNMLCHGRSAKEAKSSNSETPLIEMFGTLFSRVEKPPSKQKHLRVPIQESEPISTEQATKWHYTCFSCLVRLRSLFKWKNANSTHFLLLIWGFKVRC